MNDMSHIPASEITPESVYLRRRELIGAGLATPLLALASCSEAREPAAVNRPKDSPDGFQTADTLTHFEDASSYNNFYEFGTGKTDPAKNAHRLRTLPWVVSVEGEAEITGAYHLDKLLKGMAVQDRIYRLRCVEGWSMVIPWQGVPLAEIIKRSCETYAMVVPPPNSEAFANSQGDDEENEDVAIKISDEGGGIKR